MWACEVTEERATDGVPLDTLKVDLNIGLGLGVDPQDEGYQFAQIWDIEVDAAGNAYVLENQPPGVAVFDRYGELKFRMGRRGSGPGEFVFPQRLTWVGEELAVVDPGAGRVSFFDRDGMYVDSFTAPVWRTASDFAQVHDDVIVMQTGPAWNFRDPRSDGKSSLLLVRLPGHATDTVVTWVDSIAAPIRSGNDGVEVVVTVPYGLRGVWGVLGSEIVFGIGSEYTLQRFGVRDGRAEAWGDLRRLTARHALSDRETVAMREKIDSYAPAEETPVPQALLKPVFDRIVVGRDGTGLWVRTFGRDDWEFHIWDVYDCELVYRGSVAVPSRVRVEAVSPFGVYGSANGALGVRYVERLAMPTELSSMDAGCEGK